MDFLCLVVTSDESLAHPWLPFLLPVRFSLDFLVSAKQAAECGTVRWGFPSLQAIYRLGMTCRLISTRQGFLMTEAYLQLGEPQGFFQVFGSLWWKDPRTDNVSLGGRVVLHWDPAVLRPPSRLLSP